MRLSDKLDHKKFRPFKILRDIKRITYELKLLIIMKIYPVFHVSLLKLASSGISKGLIPILEKGMSEEEYEVKKIVDVVRRRNRLL
jgi:hypothetical protein